MRLSFDFETGTVRRNCLAQEHNCRICLPKSSVRNRLTYSCSHSPEGLVPPAIEVIS
jgi:hypothetical protein